MLEIAALVTIGTKIAEKLIEMAKEYFNDREKNAAIRNEASEEKTEDAVNNASVDEEA